MMQTPSLSIDLKKIEHNTRSIVSLCKEQGISVAGITKATLGMPEVAKAMIHGGVEWIGESRLDNIQRLRNSQIKVPFLLIRTPHLSEIERTVSLADISLNSEYEIIKALSEASLRKRIVHKIIIMVDMGDLREGIWPDELIPLVKDLVKMQGVKIIGLGMNLTDLSGVIPTYEKNKDLVDLAKEVEEKCDIKINYLSAGNSSSLKLLESDRIPNRINHFRIGEGILLGRETINREPIINTYQNAFTLMAEIIEKKKKPSLPSGSIGQDAFGRVPQFRDQGMMTRSILNIGRQDTNLEGISLRDDKLKIVGATSDHLVIDTTKNDRLSVGDRISFDLNYAALLAAMTSPFVAKIPQTS